jgi:uncharacterized protein YggU (UPF0235/DUF167 family)
MFEQIYPFQITDKGIYVNIKATPKAAANKVGKVFTDNNNKNVLKVYVTSVAEKGKANEAIIELLAKFLRISKSRISIQSGFIDKNKILLIEGDIQELKKLLTACLQPYI